MLKVYIETANDEVELLQMKENIFSYLDCLSDAKWATFTDTVDDDEGEIYRF